MGISSKIVGSLFALGLAANYSKLCLEALGTVRESVITIELTRIDQQLRQHEIMNEMDGLPPYPGDGNDAEKDQEAFVKFMADAFDTPGRDPAKDTSGNTWVYTRFPDGYRILSIGTDSEPGTDDDQWLERHGSKSEMNRSLEDIATVMENTVKRLKEEQEKVLEEAKKVAEETAADLEEAESENEEPEEPEESGETAEAGETEEPTTPEGEGQPSEEPATPGTSSAAGTTPTPGTASAASARPGGKGASAATAPASASARPGGKGASAATAPASASAKSGSKAQAASASASRPKAASRPAPPPLTPKQRRKALFGLQAGKSMLMNNRADKARSYFQKVISNYPNSSQAAEAKRQLAKIGG